MLILLDLNGTLALHVRFRVRFYLKSHLRLSFTNIKENKYATTPAST